MATVICSLVFCYFEKEVWAPYRWENRDQTNMNEILKKEYKESLFDMLVIMAYPSLLTAALKYEEDYYLARPCTVFAGDKFTEYLRYGI